MTDPKWLSDATTIADLLALPEAEQKRWEVCSDDDVEWFGWGMWRECAWPASTVVRARRRKQTVTIDADVLRWMWTEGKVDTAAIEVALAALDGDA